MAMDYFYDGQIRRYLLQFVTIFEGFQWYAGRDQNNGNPIYRVAPAKLAMRDRQVAAIQRNNSENVINTVPQITCHIAEFTPADGSRRQIPNGESEVQFYERAIDPQTNRYTNELGATRSITRLMPVPYDLTMQVDIWTSNEEQRQQLLEQILLLFNPSLDIQTGTNPLDWTSYCTITLKSINYSSRSIPIGTSNDIDITTLTFDMPIWINPPAKVRKLNLIQQIIVNINEKQQAGYFDYEGSDGVGTPSVDMTYLDRLIVTPDDRTIVIEGSSVSLRTIAGDDHDEDGNKLSWSTYLAKFGKMRPGGSQLRIKTTQNIEDYKSDIVGTLEYDITDENKLIWTIDPETLPANTLMPIDAIIDPHKVWPGKILSSAQEGQRYLILGSAQGNLVGWGAIDAKNFDIIEYSNGAWTVSFDAFENVHSPVQFVLNRRTGKQMKFMGGEWLNAIDGDYMPGYFNLRM